jgi:hypothetical protein
VIFLDLEQKVLIYYNLYLWFISCFRGCDLLFVFSCLVHCFYVYR